MVKMPGLFDARAFPNAGMGEKTGVPNLYLMGYIESHRGIMYEVAGASRRLARTIKSRAS